MDSYELRRWLRQPERKALISINVLEQQAGLPKSTLAHWLRGKRDLPERHLPAVLSVLENLSLERMS